MSILSSITFLPLIGGVLILFIPREKVAVQRMLAVLFSGIAFIVSLQLLFQFNKGIATMQFVEKGSWIPSFNVFYHLGIDGLSLPLVILTTLLSFLSIIGSLGIDKRVKEYFFWFLVLETGMLGVFVSLDFFLFYVFWEVMLVPM